MSQYFTTEEPGVLYCYFKINIILVNAYPVQAVNNYSVFNILYLILTSVISYTYQIKDNIIHRKMVSSRQQHHVAFQNLS